MGLLDAIGNIRDSIGKWQLKHGIDSSLSRGYLTRQNQEYVNKLRSLVEPLVDAARRDATGGIENTPGWSMLPQPKSTSQGKSLVDGLGVDINFAPQYNTNSQLALAAQNTSPITYRVPLSTPELMRRHAVAYSLAGVKPEALQMGMLTPDENYKAARVANKLELSANEAAELARKYGVDTINALEKAGRIVIDAVETGSKYGTENNNLNEFINDLLPKFGATGKLTIKPTKGLETIKTEAQANRDNAAANASNSTAWRNYNKPFYNPNTGGGQYDKTQISLALKDINAHQQMVKAAMKDNLGDPIDETQLPTYANYVAAQEYLSGVKQYGGQSGQPASDNQIDTSPPAQFIRQAKAEGWTKEEVLEALHSKGITNYDSYVW